MPRPQRPRVVKLHEVRITKEKDTAIIEFLDSRIAITHLTIGPEVKCMSDQEILELFNETILAQERSIASYDHVAIEIPKGKPQVRYSRRCDQWIPRGDVIRCLISDNGSEAVIEIDGRDFSPAEFSRMLTTYSGWGMRICFVPEDDIDREPRIEVHEPDEEVDP